MLAGYMVTPSTRNFAIAGILLAVSLASLQPGRLWAQEMAPSTEDGGASYLLRLERYRHREDVCVLLRGDGQYHMERHTYDTAKIFEGTIGAEELRDLVQMVSTDQLSQLRQEQIMDPMVKSDDDQLWVSVLRPINRWQGLVFVDSASREPFRESLTPLLEWLDRMQKRKGHELSRETGENHCQPPGDLELTRRQGNESKTQSNYAPHTSASVAGSASQLAVTGGSEAPDSKKDYILRMLDTDLSGGSIEDFCLLVFPTRSYHFVKQSRAGGKVHSSVLDGVLPDDQLLALRNLLDAPELKNSPGKSSDSPEGTRFILRGNSSLKTTWLSFPKGSTVQTFSGWQFYGALGSITQGSQIRGMKELAPLRQWLKENLNQSKAVPAQNPPNAKCNP
jgi:hypothetical protein